MKPAMGFDGKTAPHTVVYGVVLTIATFQHLFGSYASCGRGLAGVDDIRAWSSCGYGFKV